MLHLVPDRARSGASSLLSDGAACANAELVATASKPQGKMRTLKRNPDFTPLAIEEGDEFFPNGIFVFNITKMLAFIHAHPREFPIESVPLREIAAIEKDGGDEAAVACADLSKPVVLAEISPGHFNLIDGNHRLARARREAREALLAVCIGPERHTAFLTTRLGYQAYVEYWNRKLARVR